ncbi:VWA domain-containing protein [uncultured Pseudoalteromonas sp.]|mgnify:CR=1 FL=1|uniref:VWA domain-containing protein n=1 Tax=uncultured Pseudoalteromonas sp. TaxID=114053 RepID=UPI0030DC1E80
MRKVDEYATTMLAEMHNEYQGVFDQAPNLALQVEDRLKSWADKTNRYCILEFPYYDAQNELNAFNNLDFDSLTIKKYELELNKYKALCSKSNFNYNQDFWDADLANIKRDAVTLNSKNVKDACDLITSANLLSKEWEKLIRSLYEQWELEQITLLREKFLKSLIKKLKLIDEMLRLLTTLGIEPGILLDLSSGSLKLNNLSRVKSLMHQITNDEGIKKLLDLLGRINQVKQSERIETVTHSYIQKSPIIDINSKEEIVGIKLSKDIEHALPSELALLSDEDTSILFDLKYVESSLLCFEMLGLQFVDEEFEIEEELTVDEDEQKGPVIICIDTSGSMQGAPETVAKAVALVMSLKAQAKNRDCYIINFSTGINTLDLSKGFSLEKLTDFLSMSFHGGTDVGPAINHALNLMTENTYYKADLLIVSDFIMGSLPSKQVDAISALKLNGNKFYSLVVGNCYLSTRLREVFDQEWIYNPNNSSVTELVSIESWID